MPIRYDGISEWQRALPANTVLEVAYIGNHSVHLPIATINLNAVPQAYLSKSPVRDQAVINTLGSSSVPNPFAGLLPGQRHAERKHREPAAISSG